MDRAVSERRGFIRRRPSSFRVLFWGLRRHRLFTSLSKSFRILTCGSFLAWSKIARISVFERLVAVCSSIFRRLVTWWGRASSL